MMAENPRQPASSTHAVQGGHTPRVVVAMSGGVDSSVAAALLLDQGYEVIGVMMRLWSEPGLGLATPTNRCCTPDQMTDARRVADRLGIPFYVIDVQDQFRQAIVQFFIDEHEKGRTPNPCVECNRQIRFSYLLEHALALGADYLATGHYARVQSNETCYHLLQGIDLEKDQSYVLYTLGQAELARVLFPVGNYTKEQVRTLALEYGLGVAGKAESQDLCFLNDGDYRRFLREHSLTVQQPGPILSEDGHELGRHEGLSFYTIGQRKGLGITSAEPQFVLGKDRARNVLIVGPRDRLGCRHLTVRNVNWIAGVTPDEGVTAQVKIRYRARPVAARILGTGPGGASVSFDEAAFGVTPGQAAVFYDDQICLGGGLIDDQLAERATGETQSMVEASP